MKQKVYTIQELIPQFRELNAVYTIVLQDEKIVYPEQVFVTDFYKSFQELSFFERALIELMLAVDEYKYKVLLTNLRTETVKNISLYEAHRDFFTAVDIYKACCANAVFYDEAIKSRLQITNEYGKELTELKNELNSAEWNGRKEEETILERKIKQIQPLYEEERKKLDSLFKQQRGAEKEAAQYAHNRFADIYTLGKAMLSILDAYHSKLDEPVKEINTDNTPTNKNNNGKNVKDSVTYFSMKIIAAIYEQCNGKQFENTTETNYYSFLNLLPTDKPLHIRPGEKTRVYYLLHKMYESLPDTTKQYWRASIFRLLGIDEKSYFSKYREPVSDIPAKKSKQLAEDIDEIFDLYTP